ncbi:hypothetical protein MNBD_GAMMA10-494 [hydrothermal vent metagenome]|uniref:Hemoglobin-like protein HbO n=1 Tax=hydrothermal vent metagenome TaxID=652676 RepID=A0A3B0WY97_9ZZZZ
MPAQVNIPTYEEISIVVCAFYKKVRDNARLGHFFEHLEDFAAHEKRLTDFWWMSMGGKLDDPPKINMIGKHFPMGIKDEDLQTWLALFSETLLQHLNEAKGLYWMDKVMIISARLKQIVIDNQGMGVQISNNV